MVLTIELIASTLGMGGRPFDSAAHGPAASILLCPGNIAREEVRLARLIAPIPSAPECLTT